MPSMSSRRALSRAVAGHGKLSAGVAAAAAAGLLVTAAPAAAAPIEPNYLLETGSSGPAVAEVQAALRIPTDGIYGASTRSAVIAFQRRDGLMIDGIVGRQTWGALFGVNSVAPTYAPAYHPATTYQAPRYTAPATTSSYSHTYSGTSSYSHTYSGTSSYSRPSYSSTGYSTPSYSRSRYSYGGGYSIPSSIVQCESGGNWGAVNPSSGAGGAYQILPSTWAAYGGQGLPENASPAEQSAIAAKIYATQGPGAWVCK